MLADGRLADAARLLVVGDAPRARAGRARRRRDSVQADRPRASMGATELQSRPRQHRPRAPSARRHFGRIRAGSTGETLAHAIDLALDGELDGICFAPLNKAALHAGGWKFNDEHQMFAHLTRHQGFFGEMNVLDDLWMSRVTSHVSLRTALDQITPQRIDEALALADARCAAPASRRRASRCAALNPHGGENGLFGREEIEMIAPAVATAPRARHRVPRALSRRTPSSSRPSRGEFDGVLSMYHDQGQIATKLKGFNRGVTVTGGLATVFTTPAHGTAFDIVGQGVATTGALEQAVRLGARLAASRRNASQAACLQRLPSNRRIRAMHHDWSSSHHAKRSSR